MIKKYSLSFCGRNHSWLYTEYIRETATLMLRHDFKDGCKKLMTVPGCQKCTDQFDCSKDTEPGTSTECEICRFRYDCITTDFRYNKGLRS